MCYAVTGNRVPITRGTTLAVTMTTAQWTNRITGHADVPPDQLLANPANFRRHPKPQQDALSGVIGQIGYLDPVIVQAGTDTVIDGHLRVELALRSNQPTIPVTYVDLTDDEAALALATVDPISAMAYHDAAQLDALLREVSTDDDAVQALLDSLTESATITEGLTDPDDVPAVPSEPVTKPGDLWLLGRHRLLCGDATDPLSYDRLLFGADVQMVWADPPYGIQLLSSRGKVGHSQPYDPVLNDHDAQTAIDAFALCQPLAPKQVWWGANHYAHALPPSPCWIVWDKDHHGMTFADAELAWVSVGQPVRCFRHAWSGADRDSEKGECRVHPTQKPVALAAWAFERFGNGGDVVLDPFVGSGMSVVAAEQTSRTLWGMELAPHYCDVIVTRWQNFTGQMATLAVAAMAAD